MKKLQSLLCMLVLLGVHFVHGMHSANKKDHTNSLELFKAKDPNITEGDQSVLLLGINGFHSHIPIAYYKVPKKKETTIENMFKNKLVEGTITKKDPDFNKIINNLKYYEKCNKASDLIVSWKAFHENIHHENIHLCSTHFNVLFDANENYLIKAIQITEDNKPLTSFLVLPKETYKHQCMTKEHQWVKDTFEQNNCTNFYICCSNNSEKIADLKKNNKCVIPYKYEPLSRLSKQLYNGGRLITPNEAKKILSTLCTQKQPKTQLQSTPQPTEKTKPTETAPQTISISINQKNIRDLIILKKGGNDYRAALYEKENETSIMRKYNNKEVDQDSVEQLGIKTLPNNDKAVIIIPSDNTGKEINHSQISLQLNEMRNSYTDIPTIYAIEFTDKFVQLKNLVKTGKLPLQNTQPKKQTVNKPAPKKSWFKQLFKKRPWIKKLFIAGGSIAAAFVGIHYLYSKYIKARALHPSLH